MTGREWDTYFKSLPEDKRKTLKAALAVLKDDPVFTKEYGFDFMDLWNLMQLPLSPR
jgi:hypothetical protein